MKKQIKSPRLRAIIREEVKRFILNENSINILSKQEFINKLLNGNHQIKYITTKKESGRSRMGSIKGANEFKGFFNYNDSDSARENEKISRQEEKADGYGYNIVYYKDFNSAYKSYLNLVKKSDNLNEGFGDLDFEDRDSYIDHRGELVGMFSDNVIAGAKLAYEELKEAGVPVAEPNFNSDGDVLFIIDNESESSREWISYYYDNEIAKRENWKNPKISDFVADTLAKYNLSADWQDIATLEIKSKNQYK